MKQRILLALLIVSLFAVVQNVRAINVAILGSPNDPSWNNDVQAKLVGTGLFTSVDIHNIANTTPSLATLQGYSSVLVYSNGAGYENSTLLGNNLADYVDAGGGVVVAVFANASISLGGRFATDSYWGIIPGPQAQGTQLTLGTIHVPGHPILDGVSSFSGGSASFHSTGLVHPNATVIADWSNGSPLIVTRDIGGTPRADLNFFPPSSDGRSDLWGASTDGARLMANSLLHVAGQSTPSVPEGGSTAILLGFGICGAWVMRRKKAIAV